MDHFFFSVSVLMKLVLAMSAYPEFLTETEKKLILEVLLSFMLALASCAPQCPASTFPSEKNIIWTWSLNRQ